MTLTYRYFVSYEILTNNYDKFNWTVIDREMPIETKEDLKELELEIMESMSSEDIFVMVKLRDYKLMKEVV